MKYTKDFARYYISYQDNLSEDDKVTLLNFVNESSDIQVKALLHTGHMLSEKGSIFDLGADSDRATIFDKNPMDRRTIWDSPEEISRLDKVEANKAAAKWVKDTKKIITKNIRGRLNDLEKSRDEVYSSYRKNKAAIKSSKDTTAIKKQKMLALNQKMRTKMNSLKGSFDKGVGDLKTQYHAKKSKIFSTVKAKAVKSDLKTLKSTTVKVNATTAKLKAATTKFEKTVAKKKGMTLGKVAPTLVIAAAIAAASYALYKRFLSKSARACSNKSSAEKTLCMQQYKKRATQVRIRNMRSQMKQCNKTKDPAKCKAKTMSTIKHLQSKL